MTGLTVLLAAGRGLPGERGRFVFRLRAGAEASAGEPGPSGAPRAIG